MKDYELTCLGQEDSLQEKAASLISQEQGILIDSAKRVNLFVFNFQMEPEKVANLEKKLSESNQFGRFMVLAKKPAKLVLTSKRRFERKEPKAKVEIAEIEKKLEEILGE